MFFPSFIILMFRKTYHPDHNQAASEHWKSICLLISQAIESVLAAEGLLKIATNWNLLWRTILKNHPHPVPVRRLQVVDMLSWNRFEQQKRMSLVCVFISLHS